MRISAGVAVWLVALVAQLEPVRAQTNLPLALLPAFGLATFDGTSERIYLNGLIDEVRLYNRALTAGEVQSLYELPK